MLIVSTLVIVAGCLDSGQNPGGDAETSGKGSGNGTDTDGDGVTDSQDAFPGDRRESSDRDGDGVGDNADACPDNRDCSSRPDLIVTDIAWTPANPIAGDEVYFTITIKNQGDVAAAASTRRMNRTDGGQDVATVPVLLPGESSETGTSGMRVNTGENCVDVVADVLNVVVEADESNNGRSECFNAGANQGGSSQGTGPSGETESNATEIDDEAQPTGNRAPTFPSPMRVKTTTDYSYDNQYGLLNDTTTHITIETRPTDPDGDALTYTWSVAQNRYSVPRSACGTHNPGAVSGNGLQATWDRGVYCGKASAGTVTVVASDGKGGSAKYDVEFEWGAG
ncbi:MAG: hypothetical protein HY556_09290 [Euryarchaeota archaeon]|nr:hypothetical protein [Euryarchaeota archaeon]